ncbi:MAG: GDP-mannose 4,6-dehydratase, partial [Chloroflexi bacterium]|nr:GDP-mannose 4,6-dehydratase [Chloroflexota bacterium]
LAEYLFAHTDLDVWGLDIRFGHNVAHLDRLRQVQADLNDAASMAHLIDQVRPDYVFHLAARATPSLSWQTPWITIHDNLHGQFNLLEALVNTSSEARVLVIGSGDEYGLIQPQDLPVKENVPLRPNNPYAVSKAAQDLLGFQYYASHGLPVVRSRAFNHIGPRQSDAFVSASFARQIAEAEAGLREPVIRVGNLSAQRDFTDVRDIVRGYWLILKDGVPGQVYNLGSERAIAIEQLLDMLLAQSRVRIRIEIDPDRLRPSDVPILVSDCRKARERTGWQPLIPIEQSLTDVLDYWRARVRAS